MGEDKAFEINHTEDTRDTSDSTETHDNADADLGTTVDVTVNKDGDGDKLERPVGNHVDDSINVARGQYEDGRKTFPRAHKTVRYFGRISAYKESSEGVKKAICGTDAKDGLEDDSLPAFGEDTKEEESQGDFEERGGEYVEDFAKLDKLWSSVRCGGQVLLEPRTTKLRYLSFLLNSLP